MLLWPVSWWCALFLGERTHSNNASVSVGVCSCKNTRTQSPTCRVTLYKECDVCVGQGLSSDPEDKML